MRATNDHAKSKTGGCLLRQANFVSESEPCSFEKGELAWEASTLPLSYTRRNRIYSSPKNQPCKGGVLASSKTEQATSTELGQLMAG